MKIWVSNKRRKIACDFVTCALLRDNVQHHLESSPGNVHFENIHALADAVWSPEETVVRAARLQEELKEAWLSLEHVPLECLAVSIRTQAGLEGFAQPPPVTGTLLHSLTNWRLPVDFAARYTLGELLHTVVFDVFLVALEPYDDGALRITHTRLPDLLPPLDDEHSHVRGSTGLHRRRMRRGS